MLPGHVKGENVGRGVKLAYGRNWVWKGGAKMEDDAWGGAEIVTAQIAASFAQRYVKLLTDCKNPPDFHLNDLSSVVRWETTLGEFVYFVEVSWAEPNKRYIPQLSPRAELYLRSQHV